MEGVKIIKNKDDIGDCTTLKTKFEKRLRKIQKGKDGNYGIIFSDNQNAEMTFTYKCHYRISDFVLRCRLGQKLISKSFSELSSHNDTTSDVNYFAFLIDVSKELRNESNAIMVSILKDELYSLLPESNDYLYLTATFVKESSADNESAYHTITFIADSNISEQIICILGPADMSTYYKLALDCIYRRFHE